VVSFEAMAMAATVPKNRRDSIDFIAALHGYLSLSNENIE